MQSATVKCDLGTIQPGTSAIVYLTLLIARNTRRVKLDYVVGSSHTRLIWLIVLSAVTGWLLGLATSFLFRRRMRRAR